MKPEVRELTAADTDALHEFFNAIPPEDRTFFFQDVTDRAVAEGWTADERKIRRAAIDEDGQILAFSALNPGVDWSAHTAEVVLVVAPRARRQGLGRALARGMLIEAVQHGFKKVSVLLPADNGAAIAMFQGIGFEGEALLRDQLCSPEDGELRDVVILAHLVDEQWATMRTGGFEDALT
jgi:ribosomal protein S18 acetylase RimI-like enzyme